MTNSDSNDAVKPEPEEVHELERPNSNAEENRKSDSTSAVLQIRAQADKALDVLLKIAEKQKNRMLFPEVDQTLDIQCVYKKPSSINPGFLRKKIILPRAYQNETNTTVCLIMRDLVRSAEAKKDPDVDKQARQWEDILFEKHGITKKHVQKIMTLTQFFREYTAYNDKRQLATAYDLFVADSCVVDMVLRRCGKEFHRKRKLPIGIDLSKGHVLQQIQKAYSVIFLPLSSNRTRVSLRIGHLGQDKADILDNLQEAIARLFEFCPGGQLNVRSLYLRSANEVVLPKTKAKRKENEEVIEEISTLRDGLEVKVRRDGKIRIVDAETKKPISNPKRKRKLPKFGSKELSGPQKKKTKRLKKLRKEQDAPQDVGKLTKLKMAFATVVQGGVDTVKSESKKKKLKNRHSEGGQVVKSNQKRASSNSASKKLPKKKLKETIFTAEMKR